MVIFNSYVKLPEGRWFQLCTPLCSLIFVPASQVEKLVVIQGIVASVKTPRDKVLCSQSEDSLGPGCARQVKQVFKKNKLPASDVWSAEVRKVVLKCSNCENVEEAQLPQTCTDEDEHTDSDMDTSTCSCSSKGLSVLQPLMIIGMWHVFFLISAGDCGDWIHSGAHSFQL